ncbi:AAA family ATPase [Halovivax cerinus]|uniref:AAA family ATPase n=1 Tax=Halovivax cerinus TaxID=1487865 RepID=A0ABD5NMI1_9EURY|nr:AAA family ATPase [Halovivax cerinus]
MVAVDAQILGGVAVTVLLALLFFGVVVLWDVALALRGVADKVDKLEDTVDDDLTDLERAVAGSSGAGGPQVHLRGGGTITPGGTHTAPQADSRAQTTERPTQPSHVSTPGQRSGAPRSEPRADRRTSPEARQANTGPDHRPTDGADERSDEPVESDTDVAERSESTDESPRDESTASRERLGADPTPVNRSHRDPRETDSSRTDRDERSEVSNRGRFVASPDRTPWYRTELDRAAVSDGRSPIAGELESGDAPETPSGDVTVETDGPPNESDDPIVVDRDGAASMSPSDDGSGSAGTDASLSSGSESDGIGEREGEEEPTDASPSLDTETATDETTAASTDDDGGRNAVTSDHHDAVDRDDPTAAESTEDGSIVTTSENAAGTEHGDDERSIVRDVQSDTEPSDDVEAGRSEGAETDTPVEEGVTESAASDDGAVTEEAAGADDEAAGADDEAAGDDDEAAGADDEAGMGGDEAPVPETDSPTPIVDRVESESDPQSGTDEDASNSGSGSDTTAAGQSETAGDDPTAADDESETGDDPSLQDGDEPGDGSETGDGFETDDTLDPDDGIEFTFEEFSPPETTEPSITIDDAVEAINDSVPELSRSTHGVDASAEVDDDAVVLVYDLETTDATDASTRLLRYQLQSFAAQSDADVDVTVSGNRIVVDIPDADGTDVSQWEAAIVEVIDRTLYLSDTGE